MRREMQDRLPNRCTICGFTFEETGPYRKVLSFKGKTGVCARCKEAFGPPPKKKARPPKKKGRKG